MKCFLGGWEEGEGCYPESPAQHNLWELLIPDRVLPPVSQRNVTGGYQLGVLKAKEEKPILKAIHVSIQPTLVRHYGRVCWWGAGRGVEQGAGGGTGGGRWELQGGEGALGAGRGGGAGRRWARLLAPAEEPAVSVGLSDSLFSV